MIRQYPHYLHSVSTTPSTQDENGYWLDGQQSVTFLSVCREETDGRGSEVQIADGTYRKFSSIVQIPKGDLRIQEGTTVIVSEDSDGNIVRIKGTVLKYDKGQLHNRLWL